MGEGFAAFQEQLRSLRDNVTRLFTTLKPDVILTWNASGWTGHPDHRLVGSVVTEVFVSGRGRSPRNSTTPRSRREAFPQARQYSSPRWIHAI